MDIPWKESQQPQELLAFPWRSRTQRQLTTTESPQAKAVAWSCLKNSLTRSYAKRDFFSNHNTYTKWLDAKKRQLRDINLNWDSRTMSIVM
jgi:hypothetical protein